MKATNQQIVCSIEKLEKQRINEFYQRFGDKKIVPLDFTRQEIQDMLASEFGIEYSSSGFRNRLKSMVADGMLNRWRVSPRTVFYTLPK